MVYAKWIETDGRFAFSLTDHGGHPITESVRDALLADEAAGKIITPDVEGFPVIIDPPGPTAEQLAGSERAWRDQRLTAAMGLRDRHRDQLEIKVTTALSGEQFTELLVYMQTLRDWPQSPDFPDSQYRPTEPLWLAEQIE